MSDEALILVDETNRATGSAGKETVHRAGLLHRAFSIFIVDAKGRILLQQRNPRKYHSGGLWTNSCCGHPRPGERTLAAARRRLHEELGIDVPLSFGFFARYQALLDKGMRENEFVYVYFGRLGAPPQPAHAEVTGIAFADVGEIGRRLARRPQDFTIWFRHYFERHRRAIARCAERAARVSQPAAATMRR
jgi:isopentenyl-diphosphate delta-isomerase